MISSDPNVAKVELIAKALGPLRERPVPAFMATKFVAFADRGNSDFLASHDLEDIINLIDGRPELIDEVAQSPMELRSYLAAQCQTLLETPAFHDGLQGFIVPGSPGGQVVNVTRRLTQIANIKESKK